MLNNIKHIFPNGYGYNPRCTMKPYRGLYEKFGILDREDNNRRKIESISKDIYNSGNFYNDIDNKEIKLENISKYIKILKIRITLNEDIKGAVFDIYDNFNINPQKHIVETATILINPTDMSINLIYSAIYHEIKHIFDALIQETTDVFKENLFRDLIFNDKITDAQFEQYDYTLITPDEKNIMNCIGNFLYYIEKSECSAYLESIDNDYKDTLNDIDFIFDLRFNGYSVQQIKKILYLNGFTSGYLLFYYNIERYIKDILEIGNFNNINKDYSQNFKDIYNTNNFRNVLQIYLKRINKVKHQAMKLFNDRYKSSQLYKLEHKNDKNNKRIRKS